jgi:hypothetical protein
MLSRSRLPFSSSKKKRTPTLLCSLNTVVAPDTNTPTRPTGARAGG